MMRGIGTGLVLLGLGLGSQPLAQSGRGPFQNTSATGRPNILVILGDDIGVDLLGVTSAGYGTTPACTPNLDAFAATAVRFTNAWTSPVCSPTRAQMLTGRPDHFSGLGHISHWSIPQSYGLQAGIPTLAHLLGRYSTAAVGKWHLTDPVLGPTHPRDVAGFQYYRGSLWNLDGPGSSGYSDWLKTDLTPTSAQQFRSFAYATTDTTDDALALMQQLPQPWFIYVAYHAAHSPLHCPADEGFASPNCPAGCAPDWCGACDATGPLATTYGVVPMAARAMTSAMDAEIGRLLRALDERRTAVLFFGDNGTEEYTALPPYKGNRVKGTVYQGGLNVPFFLRTPTSNPGVNNELVSATDVFATVAELAGVALPPDPLVDSVSLVPYLVDPPATGLRSYVYAERFQPNFIPDAQGAPPPGWVPKFHHRALRDARYKLIEGFDAAGRRLELYHLADAPPQDPINGPDPLETRNLMLERATWSPEVQAAFTDLEARLASQYPAYVPPLEAPLVAKGAVFQIQGATTSTTCPQPYLEARTTDDGTTQTVRRGYLDFSVAGLPANAVVLDASLELDVTTQASLPATAVQVCLLPGQTSVFSCDELYHLLDTPIVYATSSDWTTTTNRHVSLSAAALSQIEATIAGSGVFSLGLRLVDENLAVLDGVRFFAGGSRAPRLHVTYTF